MSIDFQELKQSIFQELNKLRSHPKSYIPILENQMNQFKDNILVRPNNTSIETNEGSAAFEEAIIFLMSKAAVNPLELDERLCQAAEDLVNDIGPKGLVSHEGTQGKSLSDRIETYCEWNTCCGESIEIGGISGEEIIVSLLVNDGVADRGDRVNLFKNEYKIVGISCGNHKEYGTVTVLNFCGGVRDKDTPFYNYENFKYEYPSNLENKTAEEGTKKVKVKNSFQLNDPDAPDGTVSVKIMKSTKLYNGKKVTITKKFYTLSNGQTHVVEVEEF
jgi:uncharacterized protein YkwD